VTRLRPAAVLPALAGVVLLAGCGGGPDLRPGPQAGSAACSDLLGRLPARVLDRPRAALDVAGAAAWGEPAVVLRCGVPPTGPTSDPCIEVDDVDWTFSQPDRDFRFVTYGRSPAVEVVVPAAVGRQNAPSALIDLTGAVRPLPATARCT
jgi:hypothetical protein